MSSRKIFSSRKFSKAALFTAVVLSASGACAADAAPDTKAASPSPLGIKEDPKLDTKAQQAAPTAFASTKPESVDTFGKGDGKSYLIPAGEIVAEEFILNQYDRHFIDAKIYGSSWNSFNRNVKGSWVVDTDPFNINQFAHPYQGSIYLGLARSTGVDFWQSMGYSFMGSALWETAGETGNANINDQYTTTVGGAFLGEPLFRMASLLLESGEGRPGFWQELGATVISPGVGFNRYAFGDRFSGVFRSHNPAVYTRLQLGVNFSASVHSTVNLNPNIANAAVPQSYKTGQPTADFTMSYGLPGKSGYSYDRPFDYFHFEFAADTGNAISTVLSRGLLYGTDYSSGDNYRGIWGVYGNYDFINAQLFRVSTSGVGIGTTGEGWLSRTIAWEGTALGSVGYGSAGTIRGIDQRDYHNGVTPQGLLASRFIFGDRAAFDFTLRDYHVSDIASSSTGGSEDIQRGDVSLTFRVFNLHGITLNYAATRRDAVIPGQSDTIQKVGAISLAYTYLGHTRFGAVDWRPASAGGPK
jgi:hypothetical protein